MRRDDAATMIMAAVVGALLGLGSVAGAQIWEDSGGIGLGFADSRYVNVTGDTVTGKLQVNGALGVDGGLTVTTGPIVAPVTFTGRNASFDGGVQANATTATALAADPADCPAGDTWPRGVVASGAATCEQLDLGTDTNGNYVASVATTSPLTGGAAGSEGAALTLAIAANGIGTAELDETANFVFSNLGAAVCKSTVDLQGAVSNSTAANNGAVYVADNINGAGGMTLGAYSASFPYVTGALSLIGPTGARVDVATDGSNYGTLQWVNASSLLAISSTGTIRIGTPCVATVATNAVTCSGSTGVITDDGTDINAGTTRADITWTNTKIASTSIVEFTWCSAREAGTSLNFSVVPGAGTATLSIRNDGTSNFTVAGLKICFMVYTGA